MIISWHDQQTCLIDVTCFHSNLDHGIFHGVATCDHRKASVMPGFLWCIDNRVGVTVTADLDGMPIRIDARP
jgi:hypothetical protein